MDLRTLASGRMTCPPPSYVVKKDDALLRLVAVKCDKRRNSNAVGCATMVDLRVGSTAAGEPGMGTLHLPSSPPL